MTQRRRALLVALATAAGVTWAASGWYLWSLAWGIAALLVAALPAVRHVVGDRWGLPVALALVYWRSATVIEHPSLVWFATSAGVVAGTATLRPWRRLYGRPRAITLLAAALAMVGMTVAGIVWATGAIERSEARQASWEAEHERWLWTARPDTPQAMTAALTEQVARGSTTGRQCFEFTRSAARQFAQVHTRQPDCPRAIHLMSQRVQAPGIYMQAWLSAELIRRVGPHRLAVNACRLDFSGGLFLAGHPHAGPQLGKMLMRQSPYEDTGGLMITRVRPCEG